MNKKKLLKSMGKRRETSSISEQEIAGKIRKMAYDIYEKKRNNPQK